MCRRLKCRARAVTKVSDPDTVIIKCGSHNHGNDAYKNFPKLTDFEIKKYKRTHQ